MPKSLPKTVLDLNPVPNRMLFLSAMHSHNIQTLVSLHWQSFLAAPKDAWYPLPRGAELRIKQLQADGEGPLHVKQAHTTHFTLFNSHTLFGMFFPPRPPPPDSLHLKRKPSSGHSPAEEPPSQTPPSTHTSFSFLRPPIRVGSSKLGTHGSLCWRYEFKGSAVSQTWVCVPPRFSSCVALEELLYLSELCSLRCKRGIITVPVSQL